MIQYRTTLLLRAVDKPNKPQSQEMGPKNRVILYTIKENKNGKRTEYLGKKEETKEINRKQTSF